MKANQFIRSTVIALLPSGIGLILLLTALTAFSQSSYPLGQHTRWIEVKPGDLHFDEDEPGPWMNAYTLQKSSSDTLNLSFTQSRFWFQIKLHNPDSQARTLILEVATAWLDHLVFFSGSSLTSRFESGDMLPRSLWQLRYRVPAFRIHLAPGEEQTAWLLAHGQDNMLLPMHLWEEQSFIAWDSNRNIFYGFYFGLLAAICVINLLIFLFTKRLSFLHYTLYIGSYAVTQMALDGILTSLFPSLPPWLVNRLYASINLCTVACAGLFTIHFLAIRNYSPRLSNFVVKTCSLFFLMALVFLFFPRNTIPILSSLTVTAMFAPVALICAVVALRYNRRSAWFFLIAWAPLIISVIVLVLSTVGVLPLGVYARFVLYVGIAFEYLILSVGLGEQLARSMREHAHAKYNLEAAEAVQKAIISEMPHVPGCSIHGWYQSADYTGGDWYDVIHDAQRNRLYCFIGDVTGHGIPSTLVASAVAGTVHGVLEQTLQSERSLEDTLIELLKSINRTVQRTGASSGRLLTMNIVGIDPLFCRLS